MTRTEDKLLTTVRNVVAILRELPPDEMTVTEINVVEALEKMLAECEQPV